MTRQLFDEICQKLSSVNCSFRRYVKFEDIEPGFAQDYSGMSGRVQCTFEDIHRLISAIEDGDAKVIKEQWHILSDGHIKP